MCVCVSARELGTESGNTGTGRRCLGHACVVVVGGGSGDPAFTLNLIHGPLGSTG